MLDEIIKCFMVFEGSSKAIKNQNKYNIHFFLVYRLLHIFFKVLQLKLFIQSKVVRKISYTKFN